MSLHYIKTARAKKKHKEFFEEVKQMVRYNKKEQFVDDSLKAQVLLRIVMQLMGAIEFEKSFGISQNVTTRLSKELDRAKESLLVLGISV